MRMQVTRTAPCSAALPVAALHRVTQLCMRNRDAKRAYAVSPSQYGMIAEGEALKSWIAAHGGCVHDALSLVDAATCGCRGVVATRNITIEELESAPLVNVPQQLQLTAARAVELFEQHLPADAALQRRLSELSNTQQLAAALAYETAQGASSFWHIYCASLPAEAPGPWALPPDQLQALIDSYSTVVDTRGWAAAAAEQRLEYEAQAAELAELVGRQLSLSADQFLAAIGHVSSRSLGAGAATGLVPFCDLINHSDIGRPPMLMLDDNDRLVISVTNLVGDEVVALGAGQELYIQYAGEFEALSAFLKFGFVPAALLAEPQQGLSR